jgi:hypothetical protein
MQNTPLVYLPQNLFCRDIQIGKCRAAFREMFMYHQGVILTTDSPLSSCQLLQDIGDNWVILEPQYTCIHSKDIHEPSISVYIGIDYARELSAS